MTSQEIFHELRAKLQDRHPQTLIILGSGLAGLADQISDPLIIPYQEIKGFPQSTVSGHLGRLISGRLENKEILCMQGRFHLYEGHPAQLINTIIKAFALLGIKNLIVTNAAGSLKTELAPGSLMLITDHINFSGQNPLIGPNNDQFGPRFPDLSQAYTPAFRDRLKSLATEQGIPLQEGVYLMVMGPNFETSAEIKAFQTLGADAVGMSTVPEVIAATHSQMNILGISVITNYGTGLKAGAQDHAETLAQGQQATHNLTRLIKLFVKDL